MTSFEDYQKNKKGKRFGRGKKFRKPREDNHRSKKIFQKENNPKFEKKSKEYDSKEPKRKLSFKLTESKIFEVFEKDLGRKKVIFTKNLVPGKKVYGERLSKEQDGEYREWDASKSKLGAAILKGSTNVGIRKGDTILYLGAASGTTVSHVSDMVNKDGFVFALDFAPRVLRDLIFVSEDRDNIAPILADANQPNTYIDRLSQVDVIFQDIAQKNQVDIFLKNIKQFLKQDGYALLALKARSIDVSRKPQAIFNEVKQELEKELTIVDYRTLEPYEQDHAIFICKNK